jgi:phosphoglycolate phosphatase-like HAD superfamily hydrolase
MGRAFIFDVEGTLIDCVAANLKCWDETLTSFGIPASSEQLRLLSGMDGDDMLASLAPSLDKQARKKILTAEGERYRAQYLRGVRPFSGLRKAFMAIKGDGGRIALATDCQSDELKHYRSLMDVDDLIDAIACGDDVSKGKPDPALVELALSHLGDAPAALATMVGDTPFDAKAARRAGATAWGTLGGCHPRSSLVSAGCSVVLASAGDVAGFLEQEKSGASQVSADRP